MPTFFRQFAFPKFSAFAIIALALLACTPKFDWRDVRSDDSPYTILMPAKPATMTRELDLGQSKIVMHMTTVQVDGVSFAVGAAKLPDATAALAALTIIKANLLAKLDGPVTQQKTTSGNSAGKATLTDEFDATSSKADHSGSATRMVGKIVARENWVFQVLVVGPDKAINRDSVDTFLTSFKTI